jgi:hypothetical protein
MSNTLDNWSLADHVWPRYEQKSDFHALRRAFAVGM